MLACDVVKWFGLSGGMMKAAKPITQALTFQNQWYELRRSLLDSCFGERQSSSPFEEEYPLVLSPAHPYYSRCILSADHRCMAAHLNVLPRTLSVHHIPKSVHIGLIGNVCTHQDYRGQGLQRLLFESLEAWGLRLEIASWLLWTSIPAFFEKLGFVRSGCERRYTIHASRLPRLQGACEVYRVPADYSEPLLLHNTMLNLRPETKYTVVRSARETQMLLQIPETYAFVSISGGETAAFAVLGRGRDFQGVVHEWGFHHPEAFSAILQHILEVTGWSSLQLIAPARMSSLYQDYFVNIGAGLSRAFMAMTRPCTRVRQPLIDWDDCFIWGLDSI
ncbi:MAG: GNAT family N-acetyltransferase [Zetaproteobacteria bacterium]|nr:GNAT family N-acetyltransferase [Zetaproteobacteria bacterium]